MPELELGCISMELTGIKDWPEGRVLTWGEKSWNNASASGTYEVIHHIVLFKLVDKLALVGPLMHQCTCLSC